MIGAASIALAAGAQKPARHAQESAAERMFILYSSVLKRWTPGSGPVARRQNRVGGPVDGCGAGAPTWGRALAGPPVIRVAASTTSGSPATARSGSRGPADNAPMGQVFCAA